MLRAHRRRRASTVIDKWYDPRRNVELPVKFTKSVAFVRPVASLRPAEMTIKHTGGTKLVLMANVFMYMAHHKTIIYNRIET